jgi:hypothetical protein
MWLPQPGILFQIELDNFRIEDFAVMEFDPLPELHFQGPVIQPPPTGRQAWHRARR